MAIRIRKSAMPPAERLWLCMIFLFAVSFLNKGGYVLMAAIALTGLLYIRSIRLDVATVCLMLFSLSYSLIYTLYYGFAFTDICNYLLGPWGAYLVGKCYTRRYSYGQPLMRLMLAVSLGFFAHGTLNLFMQLFVVYDASATFRMTFDIWHNRYISVTGAGMLYTLMTGMAFGLLFSETGVMKKMLGVGIIAVSLVYSFLLAHRTTLVMVALILLLYVIRRTVKGFRFTRKNTLLLVLGFFALVFLAVCLWLDWFGLRSRLVDSSLYLRLTNRRAANSDSRFDIWMSFLRQFLGYPMGGRAFSLAHRASYVHNMWMDVYYRCGILPFAALTGAFCDILLRMARFLRAGGAGSTPLTCNCLLFVTAAFLLNAFVEPVLDANPYFLFAYLMMAGGMAGVSRREPKEAV